MRKSLSRIFWPVLYAAFVTAAYALRARFSANGETEIWGWDYGTFLVQINDWNWIAYTGFRHPGLGLVMSPLVALQHVWSDAYLWFMPGVALATAWFIRRLGGWVALAVWLAMPATWILAGTPESFPVAELLLVASVGFLVKRRTTVLFVALNGLVTLTNGLKPVLAWTVSRARRRDWLVLAVGGAVLAAAGVAFFAVRAGLNGKDWMDGVRATLVWIPSERHLAAELNGFFIRPVGWIALLAFPLACRGAFRNLDLAKILACFFAVDFVIHILVGWGMDEPWVFAPHWIWMLAVLAGEGVRTGEPGRANGIYCPGFDEATNGMSVVAKRLLADPHWKDERIVHGAWLAGTWLACLRFGTYVRMPHGSYDPVRLAYRGWKKRLVGPIERFFLRRAAKVLATCAAEKDWILAYEPKAKVEIVDIKKYYRFERFEKFEGFEGLGVHLLYLGRRHPLKGVKYLERAVEELNQTHQTSQTSQTFSLRLVSDATGVAKESQWEWCDVLVLPTLSENFGLVVAEALERGKRVITTDGAPAWADEEGRLVYLRGYRDGSDADRVRLLKTAIENLV